MALTVQSLPANFSSVHGDLIYTVAETTKTADPATYPNYKFVADIYIFTYVVIGSPPPTETLIARIRKVPQPDTKIGIFNIGQIVRNYLNFTFNPELGEVVSQRISQNEWSVFVVVKFGEEYAYTTYTGLTDSEPRQFFNNYNGRLAGQQTSLIGFGDKFLSSRPQSTKVWCGAASHFIPFMQSGTDNLHVLIRKYINGIQQGSTIDLLILTGEGLKDQYLLNVSPQVINEQSAGYITCAIDYYTIQVIDNTVPENPIEIRTFIPVCESINDVYTLHFLNKYGGFESKDFTKVSRKTINVEKKDFGKLPYTVDSSGVVDYFNSNHVYNESKATYSSQYKEKMLLNSDLLTDAEYRWLKELVVSPLVYIQMDGYYYPVQIVDTDYEEKKVVNDELTNLTINIEFGQQLNAQYR